MIYKTKQDIFMYILGLNMKRFIALCLLVSCFMVVVVSSLRCEKTPDGVSGPPSDPHDYFSIEISANPTEYTPGEQYTSKNLFFFLLLLLNNNNFISQLFLSVFKC